MNNQRSGMMKKVCRKTLLGMGVWVMLAEGLGALTFPVLPGESIQAQIDAAADGDVIAIFGGTYDENLTVNKSVRLAEVEGEVVILTGNITFTGLTDPPPFSGFVFGNSGRKIVVSNVTGLLIDEIDSKRGDRIEINSGSDVLIRGGEHKDLVINSGTVEVHSSDFNGSVTQNGGALEVYSTAIAGDFVTADAATKTLAFRTQVGEDCTWRSNRSWFAYSKARSFNFQGSNAKVVLVGSEIDRQNGEADSVHLAGGSNSYYVYNNVIKGTRSVSSGDENAIDIRGGGNQAFVANNYLYKTHAGSNYGTQHAIRVSSTTDVQILNNIIHTGVAGMVYAPLGVLIQNNLAMDGLTGVGGGASVQGTLTGDPGFVDGDPYTLAEGSPCIDAGVDDGRYNDLDGTRNDIGPSGGSAWDPDGWTTANPVMIAFELSTDIVLEGQTTSIELSEAFGVSAP